MIKLDQIHFRYPKSDFSLRIDHLEIASGQAVAFIGPSGSGKTTLLHLIGGIVETQAGSILVQDFALHQMPEPDRRALRMNRMGLVFQEFELLSYLSVLDNILLPCRISPRHPLTKELKAKARRLAEQVDLPGKLGRFPDQLSHGEKQRVALCRALLLQPSFLLADEPTGNLDPANKGRIMDILFDYARHQKATLITVTHDRSRLEHFDHVVDFQQFHEWPATPGEDR